MKADRLQHTSALPLKWACFRIASAICIPVVVFCIARYPFGPFLLATSIALYAAVLLYWPNGWLLLLPALLPVLNFYPWTGWLYIEEFDLFLLATLAIGYLRSTPDTPRVRMSVPAAWATTALAISYLTSALISASDVEHWSWSATGSYNTPINGLRILKGFIWSLLLLPLLSRAFAADQRRATELLTCGMLIGLGTASGVVLWERWAFPGFMDFSSEYRAIGSFFETHVGGAALDGYLALSLPFAATYLLTARKPLPVVLGAAAMVLGTYAALTTFSRGLYAGLAVAAGMGLTLAAVGVARKSGLSAILLMLFVGGVILIWLVQVFATGGYRTLAAALGTFAAAYYMGALSGPVRWSVAGAASILMSITTVALLQFVPKGAYIAYAISMVCMLAIVALEQRRVGSYPSARVAVCLWIALNAAAVGWHWGGTTALQDAAISVAIAIILALYNRRATDPYWSLSQRSITLVALAGIALSLVIPVVGNYYIKSRVQATSSDLRLREEHWSTSVAIQGNGNDLQTRFFGAGLGRYPERYFWNNRKGEFPGAIAYLEEGGRQFARLGGGRNTPDHLRMSQRIDVDSHQPLSLKMTLRTQSKNARIGVGICERWLIYTGSCAKGAGLFVVKSNEWTDFSAEFNTETLGKRHWWGTRPTAVMIIVEGENAVADIAEVKLQTTDGVNLITNSDFSVAPERWFFTSDRSHLPWHAKNLWLGVWFDQGWFGLAAFLLFTVTVLAQRKDSAVDSSTRTALLAGLVAFFVVGLFDTLVDATRLAVLFYMLSFVLLLKENRAWMLRPSRSSTQ